MCSLEWPRKAYGFVKGGIPPCERPPFTSPNMAFCTLKGGLSHGLTQRPVSQELA